jgi:hypothetical protein
VLSSESISEPHAQNAEPSDTESSSNTIEEVNPEEEDYAEEKRILLELSKQPANLTIHQIVSQRGNRNRLFTTASGWLGIADTSIQRGDKVFLCSGMRLPMIMREKERSYCLISASWVHGIMMKELWPDNQAELRKLALI